MKIELTWAEARLAILKGMGLENDAVLKYRNHTHELKTVHEIVIVDLHLCECGEGLEVFPYACPTAGDPNLHKPVTTSSSDIPDDCYMVDGVDVVEREFEEFPDGKS